MMYIVQYSRMELLGNSSINVNINLDAVDNCYCDIMGVSCNSDQNNYMFMSVQY